MTRTWGTAADERREAWAQVRRTVTVAGQPHVLRLTRFANGWLASADSVAGPTLGADHSPYLAAWRALEPLGLGLQHAIAAVADI